MIAALKFDPTVQYGIAGQQQILKETATPNQRLLGCEYE